jgi:hypothetical protein
MSVNTGKSHRGVNRANVNHPSAFRSVNPCVSIHRFRHVRWGRGASQSKRGFSYYKRLEIELSLYLLCLAKSSHALVFAEA